MNNKGYERWKLMRSQGALKYSFFYGFCILGFSLSILFITIMSILLGKIDLKIILTSIIIFLPGCFITLLVVYYIQEIEYWVYNKKVQQEKSQFRNDNKGLLKTPKQKKIRIMIISGYLAVVSILFPILWFRMNMNSFFTVLYITLTLIGLFVIYFFIWRFFKNKGFFWITEYRNIKDFIPQNDITRYHKLKYVKNALIGHFILLILFIINYFCHLILFLELGSYLLFLLSMIIPIICWLYSRYTIHFMKLEYHPLRKNIYYGKYFKIPTIFIVVFTSVFTIFSIINFLFVLNYYFPGEFYFNIVLEELLIIVWPTLWMTNVTEYSLIEFPHLFIINVLYWAFASFILSYIPIKLIKFLISRQRRKLFYKGI